MLALVLTTACCKEIIHHLLDQRGWTISRIAKTVGATPDYVLRIQEKKQSFQVSDVEALAKALGVRPAMLLFEATKRNELSPKVRVLYDMALEQIEMQKDFQKGMSRKPVKKRRVRPSAA